MKKSDLKEFIREEIIEILSEADTEKEIEDTKELTKAVQDLQKAKEEAGLTEDEDDDMDKQAMKAAKKGDSIASIASRLANITKEMKQTVNKYKKAEGSEKELLLKRLKELTKIKKELESLL